VTAGGAGSQPLAAAFEGVRVVELAEWVFVPAAGALLADWGADVVRIERTTGDPYRALTTQGIGAERIGVNLSVALANRGKRSIALDVQREQGAAVLHRLLQDADVLLTSFRPAALERLGLSASQLRERYPRLIFARGHGYGVRGPDANRAGYDAAAFWARGGLGHVLTPQDRDFPISQRGAMGDRNAGMSLAFGIAAALVRRANTGQGSVIDVSLLATAMMALSTDVLAAIDGQHPRASVDRTLGPNPLAATFRTRDGGHLQLVFLESDRYWVPFCKVIGREDLVSDPRFVDHETRCTNRAACLAVLDAEFGSRTLEEWKAALGPLDAPWAPVQAVEGLLDDPQVLANGYLGEVAGDGPPYRLPAVPVQFDEEPPPMRRAPEHGEQTEIVLLELGYSWDEIAALRDSAVIP
jgi:crotonobetainyl-CoA:carnitine CoA-transferase CaiB-like acyl-CoA transferase